MAKIGSPMAFAILLARANAEGEDFTWGRDDCLLWLADIYVHALGRD
jgi:hypothetical protein